MSESFIHKNLVCQIKLYVSSLGSSYLVSVDDEFSPPSKKPKNINGYIPDLYAFDPLGGTVLIGEAKTRGDVDNEHTYEQLGAFIKFCKDCKKAKLIIAVPFYMVPCVKGIVRYLKQKIYANNVEVVFLKGLDG